MVCVCVCCTYFTEGKTIIVMLILSWEFLGWRCLFCLVLFPPFCVAGHLLTVGIVQQKALEST